MWLSLSWQTDRSVKTQVFFVFFSPEFFLVSLFAVATNGGNVDKLCAYNNNNNNLTGKRHGGILSVRVYIDVWFFSYACKWKQTFSKCLDVTEKIYGTHRVSYSLFGSRFWQNKFLSTPHRLRTVSIEVWLKMCWCFLILHVK